MVSSCDGKFWTDIRKSFFIERVVRNSNRLCGAVVMLWSCCQSPRKNLGCVLRCMLQLFGHPVWSQESDSVIIVGPSQLRIFCDFNWKNSPNTVCTVDIISKVSLLLSQGWQPMLLAQSYWHGEGHAACSPPGVPVLSRQPQPGACLDSNKGSVFHPVSSTLLV